MCCIEASKGIERIEWLQLLHSRNSVESLVVAAKLFEKIIDKESVVDSDIRLIAFICSISDDLGHRLLMTVVTHCILTESPVCDEFHSIVSDKLFQLSTLEISAERRLALVDCLAQMLSLNPCDALQSTICHLLLPAVLAYLKKGEFELVQSRLGHFLLPAILNRLSASSLAAESVNLVSSKLIDDCAGQILYQIQGYLCSLKSFDFQSSPKVFEFIQLGLCSGRSVTQKCSSHLLKRIVSQSDKSTVWRDFFLLNDALDHSNAHLIQPLLNKLYELFASDLQHSWWFVLLRRGLSASHSAVRIMFLEFILNIRSPSMLKSVISNLEFIDFFYSRLNDTSHFAVPGLGQFKSPFGELVSAFVNASAAFSDNELANAFIERTVFNLSLLTSRIPVIFVLQGLAKHSVVSVNQYPLGGELVVSTTTFLVGRSVAAIAQNSHTFDLIACLWMDCLLAFASRDTLHSTNMTFALASMIRQCSCFSAKQLLDAKQLVSSLQESVPLETSQFLSDCSNDAFVSPSDIQISNYLALLLLFLASDDVDRALDALHEWKDQITRLHSPYQPQSTKKRLILLLASMSVYRDQLSLLLGADFVDFIVPTYDIEYVCDSLADQLLCATQPEWADVLVRLLPTMLQILASNVSVTAFDEKITSWIGNLTRDLDSDSRLLCARELKLACILIEARNQRLPNLNLLELGMCLFQTEAFNENAKYASSDFKTKSLLFEVRYELIHHCLKSSVLPDASVFVLISERLESSTFDSATMLLKLATELLDANFAIIQDEIVCAIVRCGLKVADDLARDPKLWSTIIDLVSSFGFHHRLLIRASLRTGLLSGLLETLFKYHESRLGILILPARKLYEFWLLALDDQFSEHAECIASIHDMMDWFIKLGLVGSVRENADSNFKNDGLIVLKLAEKHKLQDEIDLCRETASFNFFVQEYVIRVQINDILLRLERHAQDPNIAQLGEALLMRLLEYPGVRPSKKKYHNSHEHRLTMRLWMMVHILLPFMPESKSQVCFSLMLDAAYAETLNEARVYIEWAISRTLLAIPRLRKVYWKELESFGRKAQAVISLLTMGLNIYPHITDATEKREFMLDAIFGCLRWSGSHHFSIRVVAQYGLATHWERCKHDFPGLCNDLHSLGPLIDYAINSSDSQKHISRCNKYYFFGGGFDIVRDVNVDFIFRRGLCVLEMADDEKISFASFVKLNPSQGYSIPLCCDDNVQQMVQSSVKLTAHVVEQSVRSVDKVSGGNDYQRKITPWEHSMTTNIDFSSKREDLYSLKKRSTLIVICSLIDKTPNLGGLCRTSEIFNAEMVVLNDVKITEDPVFKALSMGSEEWVPSKEVKKDDLEAYLLDLKHQGYKLVGVEQASNSQSLEKFVFPTKCALLLGKEREGIPAEYLCKLDYIVEIPQLGLIRSLNVHVSGALMIWEYSKQHSLNL